MVMNRWLDHWQTHSFGNWAISLLTNPEKIIGFGGLGIRNYDEFLASVQTMEIVPSFAVGSAVGLRGFMSYIFGASLGTSLFGVMVDKMGWHGGFYLLMGGIVCCILFCYLSHRGALELEQQRKITEQEEARLALADAQ